MLYSCVPSIIGWVSINEGSIIRVEKYLDIINKIGVCIIIQLKNKVSFSSNDFTLL